MILKPLVWKTVAIPSLFGMLLAGTYVVTPVETPAHYRFQTVADMELFARDKGLLTHQDADFRDQTLNNIYLSTQSISPDKVKNLWKGRFATDPAWKGLVWIYELRPNDKSKQLAPAPDQFDGHRVWDNLVLVGDAELLDRLEQLRGL